MKNINLSIVSILGMLAIVLGAFGAHILKEKLGVESMRNFETGVRYQMYHVILLLFINTYNGFSMKSKNVLSVLFVIGILFFSGSLYIISLGWISPKSIWFITPLGGLLLTIGWFLMSLIFIRGEMNVNK